MGESQSLGGVRGSVGDAVLPNLHLVSVDKSLEGVDFLLVSRNAALQFLDSLAASLNLLNALRKFVKSVLVGLSVQSRLNLVYRVVDSLDSGFSCGKAAIDGSLRSIVGNVAKLVPEILDVGFDESAGFLKLPHPVFQSSDLCVDSLVQVRNLPFKVRVVVLLIILTRNYGSDGRCC